MKQTDPTRKKDANWKLTVLNRIENGTAREVCEHLGISESTLNYHLNKWKKLDVIEKIGYGTWKVNRDKIYRVLKETKRVVKAPKQLRIKDPCRSTGGGGSIQKKFVVVSRDGKEISVLQDSDAGHGFMFVLCLPQLTRWTKGGRRKYLLSKGIEFKEIQQGERLWLDRKGEALLFGWKVHLTGKSIVGYAPKGVRWHGERARDTWREALCEWLRVVKRLEGLLMVGLSVGGRYKIRTRREHHALMGNALAAEYTKSGEKLFLRDSRGLWGLIDASVLPGEFETVRAGVGGRDANERVQDFFNGVKDTGLTPAWVLESIHGLAENARVFGEHMRTHVSVMGRIDKTLERLNVWLDKK